MAQVSQRLRTKGQVALHHRRKPLRQGVQNAVAYYVLPHNMYICSHSLNFDYHEHPAREGLLGVMECFERHNIYQMSIQKGPMHAEASSHDGSARL